MKAAFLAVTVLLVTGGLYVWTTTPALLASAPPVQPFDVSSSGSVWWVGASSTDSSALPNTGVQGTIQVISTPVVGCLAFWVSDDLSNSVWGQVGYEICDTSTPISFYQIWNLDTNAILMSGTTSLSTGSHTFSMYLQSGTTWAYSLDGTVFGTYNMGASSSSSSYPVYALSEEEGSSTFTFPAVEFSTAMQVMKSGTWSSVQTGTSYVTGNWGVVGAAQGTGLRANQITVGGSLAVLPQGTQLWSAGTTSTASSSSTSTSSSASTSSTATLPPATSTVTSTRTSTASSTVKSTATSTVTSTTAKTTTSTVTSPTTMASTVTATQTSTGTVTSISTITLPQTTTAANQTTATTDTQTVTSTLTLNHTSAVTRSLTLTSATFSTSIQPTTVTETTPSQVTTTVTQIVPSTATVTSTLSGAPAASTTCSNRTGSLSNLCPFTAGISTVPTWMDGGSVLAVLAASLTCLALVVRRRAHSLIPKTPKMRVFQSGLVPRSADSLPEGRKDASGKREQR